MILYHLLQISILYRISLREGVPVTEENPLPSPLKTANNNRVYEGRNHFLGLYDEYHGVIVNPELAF